MSESINKNSKIFTVYMHVCKNNDKKYIGITCRIPEKRWQNGGGYPISNQPLFGKAIQKYGWDNFDHHIIATNLTELEAKELERDLIIKYNTTDRNFGYNILSYDERGRAIIPEEVCQKIGNGNRGKKRTEEDKFRMSEVSKKIWEENYEKMKASRVRGKNHHMWGTHLTNEAKEKLRIANIGKHMSEEAKRKISEATSGEKNIWFGKHHTTKTKQLMSEIKNKDIEKISGENSLFSKITNKEAIEIYFSNETQINIAKKYNIDDATVNHIKQLYTWKFIILNYLLYSEQACSYSIFDTMNKPNCLILEKDEYCDEFRIPLKLF